MMDLFREDIDRLLMAVGEQLTVSGASASIVVVGGAALVMAGYVSRTTRDVDIIARVEQTEEGQRLVNSEPLPTSLSDAIKKVARDFSLSEDWMNTAIGGQWELSSPADLIRSIRWRRYEALNVGFVDRGALIALKLFAAVDQGDESVHFQDLLVLDPNESELRTAEEWVRQQDASEVFQQLVAEATSTIRNDAQRNR